MVEPDRASDGPARVELTELEETVEHRAVIADIDVEAFQIAHVLVLVLGRDQPQELDVVVRVELCEIGLLAKARLVDLQRRRGGGPAETSATTRVRW